MIIENHFMIFLIFFYFHWKFKQFTPFYLVKITRNFPNFTSDARAEIESYELNQGSFGIFEACLMGNWSSLCDNGMLPFFGQP